MKWLEEEVTKTHPNHLKILNKPKILVQIMYQAKNSIWISRKEKRQDKKCKNNKKCKVSLENLR